MRTNAHPPMFILALNCPTQKEDVAVLHSLGVEHFGVGKGSYEGQTENAYLLSAAEFAKVRPHLHEYNQESVLFLDNQRNAFLCYRKDGYYLTEKAKYVGEFKEVAKTTAAGLQNWCCFSGIYYAAR